MIQEQKDKVAWSLLRAMYRELDDKIALQRKSVVLQGYLKGVPYLTPFCCVGRGIRGLAAIAARAETDQLLYLTNTTIQFSAFLDDLFSSNPQAIYAYEDGIIFLVTYMNLLYACARQLAQESKEVFTNYETFEQRRAILTMALKDFYYDEIYWENTAAEDVNRYNATIYTLLASTMPSFVGLNMKGLSWSLLKAASLIK